MPEMKEGGVNVTPLIDVVMCLIIFFMLVAKIGVAGFADPTIDTPASILGKELKDKASTLTLNVRGGQQGSDQPFVTALVEGGTGGLQEIKLLEPGTSRRPLLEVLKKLRKGDPAHGVPENRNFAVIVHGDKDMAYRFLEPVLITCAEAGIQKLDFETKKATAEVPAR
jgi:biopolymer transport protein ExbD